MKDAALIALGWLFGLLAPRIIDAIKKPYTVRDLQHAISSELKEIKRILAGNVFVLEGRLGVTTLASAKWCLANYEAIPGDEKDKKLIEMMNRLVTMTEESIRQASNLRQLQSSNKTINVRYLITPFIDAQIGLLYQFDLKYQRKLIDIIRRIKTFNEVVEEVRYYHQLTFDSNLSTPNRNIVTENINNNTQFLIMLSKDLVTLLSTFLKEYIPA